MNTIFLIFIYFSDPFICKGIQCTVGCLPYGSICPSETEIKLQQNLPLSESTTKIEYVKPIKNFSKPKIENFELFEEKAKQEKFRKRLGYGLGFGIPSSQFIFTGLSFLSLGIGLDKNDDLLDKPDEKLHPMTITGISFMATGLLFGIIAIVLSSS